MGYGIEPDKQVGHETYSSGDQNRGHTSAELIQIAFALKLLQIAVNADAIVVGASQVVGQVVGAALCLHEDERQRLHRLGIARVQQVHQEVALVTVLNLEKSDFVIKESNHAPPA